MLTPDDLITLPYTADLTRAGVAYAGRSLGFTFDRMGGSVLSRLRRVVAGVAVELALRRYLVEQGIPFDVWGATPFTEPDRYDLALGGRRCDVKSYLISDKGRIRCLRRDPGALLGAPALVPSDQLASERLREEDLFVFAFLAALLTRGQADLQRALAAGQPQYLLAPTPPRWSRADPWAPLGRLALKADVSRPLRLELGGQGSDRQFQTEELTLPPRVRVQAEKAFHTLAYLHASELPDGRVGVYSPRLEETHIVPSGQWGNIWVYGLQIVLVGYATCGEMRRRARRLPPGSRVFQYRRTRTENMARPMRELRPLTELFDRARRWADRRGAA